MSYSTLSPLPPLRHDLELAEVLPGIIRLYDDVGYTETTVQLPLDVIDLLLQMNSRRTGIEIHRDAVTRGSRVTLDRFLEIVNTLDEEGFLESPTFFKMRDRLRAEYNRLPVRPPMFAGLSYPDNPSELTDFLQDCLDEGGAMVEGIPLHADRPPDALIVPHIDPQIGGRLYGAAYSTIAESDADTFIILGVPHKISYDRFMLSTMDFDTPIGRLPTDKEFIEQFRNALPFAITEDQIAHMPEHSIEFQTIFLRYLFQDRDISIVPILSGSLYQYVETGRGGIEAERDLAVLYATLADTAARSGRKVCWIASVDYCHVGHKFGDSYTARSVFEAVRSHDMDLISYTTAGDPAGYISYLTGNRNQYNVCGVSPTYALLRTAPPTRGTLLGYDQFDESERNSGVSFASVALWRDEHR